MSARIPLSLSKRDPRKLNGTRRLQVGASCGAHCSLSESGFQV